VESFEFVIVAVITQYIIGIVKPLSSKFHKLALISFRHRMKLIAQRLSSANKELKLYILVYTGARPVARI